MGYINRYFYTHVPFARRTDQNCVVLFPNLSGGNIAFVGSQTDMCRLYNYTNTILKYNTVCTHDCIKKLMFKIHRRCLLEAS